MTRKMKGKNLDQRQKNIQIAKNIFNTPERFLFFYSDQF